MEHCINLNIHYTASDDIWENWYQTLKQKLTDGLEYEIGEPEDGYEFKYYD